MTESRRNAAAVSALISAVMLLAIFATRADAALLSGYCSPTGDYCTSVSRTNAGKYILGINTFSFRGRYTLCARHVATGNRQCKRFRLRTSDGDIYKSNINFRRQFRPTFRGKWCATWRKFGGKLGPANCFGYRGPIGSAG